MCVRVPMHGGVGVGGGVSRVLSKLRLCRTHSRSILKSAIELIVASCAGAYPEALP